MIAQTRVKVEETESKVDRGYIQIYSKTTNLILASAMRELIQVMRTS